MRVGNGANDSVLALLGFDAGSGPVLYVGGSFTRVNDSGDSFLGRWQGCVDLEAPVLSCPAAITVAEGLSGAPGAIVTFSVSATDDLDPDPLVECVPPSGSVFPRGITLVSCTATDDAGRQSSCSFPVNVERKARRR